MNPWVTYVHARFCTEGRCASQNVLNRRRGICHADSVPRTLLLAPMEVKEVWVVVAASDATVHGAIVHSNVRVQIVDVSMFFRSDAETACRSKWNDRHRHADPNGTIVPVLFGECQESKSTSKQKLLKTCTCEDRVWRYVIIYVYIHTYIYPRIR